MAAAAWRDARHNARPPDGRHSSEAVQLVFRVLVAGDGYLFRGKSCLCPARVASDPRITPKDSQLHRISTRRRLQRPNFYQPRASFRHTGRYSHAHAMTFDVDRDGQTIAADTEDDLIAAAKARFSAF
jgi:hypothetical protein